MPEKLANPAPLGLACFALTTFLLSAINAELAQKDLIGAVVSCALVYGGVVQIMAGMLESRQDQHLAESLLVLMGDFG